MLLYRAIVLFLLTTCTANALLAQNHLYSEKKVTIKNDGWNLVGDLVLVHTSGKSPIVLMLNKANGNRKAYDTLAKLLADQHVSSFRVDLRGHGESTNKGEFVPFDSVNNEKINLKATYTDIIAAENYLFALKSLDSAKFGIIGASYSAEEMLIASRQFRQPTCYIALSPGSISDTSLAGIDRSKPNVLFVKSMDEKSMKGFEEAVFLNSKKAQVLIVSGSMHATDILAANPDVSLFLADWLSSHL